ncbi:M23 family metallopeptidase [Alicyclobacillus sp.]|uniref:M23 family metallopeptidase n=1 Tax=Alicyclobacillus sp. TaxID=61169 RepID=UPI0025C67FD1|nr:M23 family metallopeptidase [Alicyclobacillus sp.]MCL6516160.1 M23 family metallopeptidase [Alicyclobacillus sp.]
MTDRKSIWPWKDPVRHPHAATVRPETEAPDLTEENPWFQPRGGRQGPAEGGRPGRSPSAGEDGVRWLGDVSPYGFLDEDGSLQQAEGANWRRTLGRRPARRFIAQSGRSAPRTQGSSGANAGGGTWLLQTVCAIGLVAAGLYAHGHQGGLADEIGRVYQLAFTQDDSHLTVPVVKQFLDDHGIALPAFLNTSTTGAIRLHTPLNGTIQADFGPNHPEIWIAGTANEPVLAAGTGTVSQVTEDGDGWTVVLQHGTLGNTLYRGLGTVSVQEGQAVQVGQVIGRLPQRENPVLRFAMQRNGAYINPHDDIQFPESGA